MLNLYLKLSSLALEEFKDITNSTRLIGGKAASPNKLRINFYDESFLDVYQRMEITHITGNIELKEA